VGQSIPLCPAFQDTEWFCLRNRVIPSMSSISSATISPPRSLPSIAKLNMERSCVRPSLCSESLDALNRIKGWRAYPLRPHCRNPDRDRHHCVDADAKEKRIGIGNIHADRAVRVAERVTRTIMCDMQRDRLRGTLY